MSESEIPKVIDSLNKEIENKTVEVNKLISLYKQFPNLQRQVGRWSKAVYYSKDVNAKVNRFDMRHNCGCCNDSPLEVWPYLETEYGNVYSDPPTFMIGERRWDNYSIDKPYPDWEEKLIKAELPEDIIGAISMHFRSEDYKTDEESEQ